MSWLSKLMPSGIRTDNTPSKKRSVPEGLWEKCSNCGSALYRPELEENPFARSAAITWRSARARLAALFDADSTTEIGARLGPTDLLVQGPEEVQRAHQDRAEEYRRVRRADRHARPAQGPCAGGIVFRLRLHGRLDGLVVGERFALAAETAVEIGAPYVCFSQSGGARMQEGLFSLMQMAKTSAALGKLREAGLPYISVLTHPTTGVSLPLRCWATSTSPNRRR